MWYLLLLYKVFALICMLLTSDGPLMGSTNLKRQQVASGWLSPATGGIDRRRNEVVLRQRKYAVND